LGRPRVLGVDVGFVATGLAVVELAPVGERDLVLAVETVRTVASGKKRGLRVADSDAERCQEVARAVLRVARQWDVSGLIVELPNAGAQGARPNRAMGMATGVIAACVEALVLPVEWVTPFDVKKVATGRRSGTKEQVQEAVTRLLEWAPGTISRVASRREHEADAAGAVRAADGGVLIRSLRPRRTA